MRRWFPKGRLRLAVVAVRDAVAALDVAAGQVLLKLPRPVQRLRRFQRQRMLRLRPLQEASVEVELAVAEEGEPLRLRRNRQPTFPNTAEW